MPFLHLARVLAVLAVMVASGCAEGRQPPTVQGTGSSHADWSIVSDPARGYA